MSDTARLKVVVAALLVLPPLAPLAHAQGPATRSALAAEARDEKAAAPNGPVISRTEKVLNALEQGRARQLFAPREGFSLRIGGIDDGSGLAVGPRWRKSTLVGGRLILHGSTVQSIRGERAMEAGWLVPKLGSRRVGLAMDFSSTHLTRERLFQSLPGGSRASATIFGVDQRLVSGTAMFTATDWLRVTTRMGHLRAASSAPPGKSLVGTPPPGLDDSAAFAVASVSATVDSRDVPGNPRHGGRYHLTVERFADQERARYSFTRVGAELEQHLSMLRRQRVVTLRAVTSLSQADPHQAVPVFLQPTLGGSQVLRGFITDRFRAPNIMALQAEYGWDVWPFMGAVLFYETGKATEHWRQALSLSDLRRDYGLGFRFGSARTVALRTDVAFGSGEGTRLSMRMSHAF